MKEWKELDDGIKLDDNLTSPTHLKPSPSLLLFFQCVHRHTHSHPSQSDYIHSLASHLTDLPHSRHLPVVKHHHSSESYHISALLKTLPNK